MDKRKKSEQAHFFISAFIFIFLICLVQLTGKFAVASEFNINQLTQLEIPSPSNVSSVGQIIEVPGKTFAAISEYPASFRLYVLDNSTDGASIITTSFHSPSSMFYFNGFIYLKATDASGDEELWRVDINTYDTIKIDLNPADSSSPASFFVFNDKLFFAANHETYGRELWCLGDSLDGSNAYVVKDLKAGTSSNPGNFLIVGSQFYFTAQGPTVASRVWVSDGTEVNTQLVSGEGGGCFYCDSSRPLLINDQVYFYKELDGGSRGTLYELFRITGGGVQYIGRLNKPTSWFASGTKIYYRCWCSDQNHLYVYDLSTLTSTRLSMRVREWSLINDTLYFTTGSNHNYTLIKTRGTVASTKAVSTEPSYYRSLRSSQGALYLINDERELLTTAPREDTLSVVPANELYNFGDLQGKNNSLYCSAYVNSATDLYSFARLIPPDTVLLGSPGGPYNQSGSEGEPVNTATGNYYYQYVDLSIPGRGMAFQLKLTYNSHDTYNGPLGYGWRHPYHISLNEDTNHYITVKFGDGHEEFFQDDDSDGTYTGIYAGMHNVITKHGDNSFTLTRKDLSAFSFDSAGQLITISDKNNNQIAFSYIDGNMTTILDTAGRSITFTYDGEDRITSIADPAGRAVTYSYDANGDMIAATDPNGNAETYTYDDQHQMLSITNRRSHILIDNTYDDEGRVITQDNGRGFTTTFAYDTPAAGDTSITDGLGQTTIHHHDSNNRLTRETDPQSNMSIYTYDNDNNRIAVTDKNGNTTEYTYDLNGNILTKTDPWANMTSITYDVNNHPLTSTDALGNTTQFEYDDNANIVRVVDPLGNQFITTYNSFGQIAAEIDGAGRTTTYSYDITGNINSILDPEGNTTTFTYNAAGRILSQTDANGNTATKNYDNNSNLLSLIDKLGNITSYTYDENNNPLTEVNALGHTTAYSYDQNDNLISVTDLHGNTTQSAYDAADQLIQVTDARNNTTTYEYDTAGNRTGITDALGHQSIFTLDPAGNILTTADPLGNTTVRTYDANNNLLSITDPNLNITSFTYDALNRQATKTNANNQTTTFFYDELGNLVSVTDPAGGVVQVTYDAVGNRLSQTDTRNNTTTYQYDNLNRLIQEQSPLGGLSQYTYDGIGNLTSKIAPNGNTIDYAYDANNRLVSIDYPISTDVAISYDAIGNRTGMTDGLGSYIYTYDALNRLVSHADPFGKVVGYEYDQAGNMTSLIYPGGNTVTYQYDALNRMTTVTDWQSGVNSYIYDASGRLIGTTNANGTTAQYSFDASGRLLTLQNRKSDSTEINSYAYTLDPIGNILEETRNEPLAPVMTEIERTYSHDADDRMLSDGTAGYSYDANGNQVTAGTDTFAFDEDNRLSQSVIGGITSSYGYDADGNRRVHTENSVTTNYVLDINRKLTNVLAETDVGGTITAYYVYGQGLIERILPDNTVHTYHYDSRGSTIAVSDSAEDNTDSYAYDAYGRVSNSAETTNQPFHFLGGHGVLDDGNGLNYVRARYYAPENGRFVGKDVLIGTMLSSQTLNRYLYGMANPIKYVDTSGYSAKETDGNDTCSGRLYKYEDIHIVKDHWGFGENGPDPLGHHFIEVEQYIEGEREYPESYGFYFGGVNAGKGKYDYHRHRSKKPGDIEVFQVMGHLPEDIMKEKIREYQSQFVEKYGSYNIAEENCHTFIRKLESDLCLTTY